MDIKGFHHVAITVADLNRSVEFYEQFGFVRVQEFERKDLNGKAIFLQLAGMRLELWEFTDASHPQDDLSGLKIQGIRHIALLVSDVDAVYARLKSQLKISPPKLGASGGKYSFLSDPNGIQVELYEPS